MALQLVPLQLRLFPPKVDPEQCDELTGRTGNEWLRSIKAYLAWRAGEPWRDLTRASHRRSPLRWEYLEAIRLIDTHRYAGTDQIETRANVERKAPQPVVPAQKFPSKSRGQLVSELMAIDSTLTNKKILLHLATDKLERMLSERHTRRRA